MTSQWIWVLGEAAAAQSVLSRGVMGFRKQPPQAMAAGDDVAIYLTRGAFHNPTRDFSRIVAIGRVESGPRHRQVQIAGGTYGYEVRFAVLDQRDLRAGVAFAPLVASLEFIRNKKAWASYLRRTVVSISAHDFDLIAGRLAEESVDEGDAP